ncbi:hypothetical protein TSAR_012787 [Trichomalopsis sarcophagae]|uniref:Endonuclease/exonuclease/phosphatase domain-containing protein n=1 Tax=Trichomalopsis sarcophagae TaxID=543379 RepID=A0A232EN79_9HYME|nr:hypothetical protein TSAR_012787 [Trichomalopsis sarcophagae]
MQPTLRIMTQTANRSLNLADMMIVLAIKQRIDVLVMHAPPMLKHRIPGCRFPTYFVTCSEVDQVDTAIVIFNKDLQPITEEAICNNTCTCLRFKTIIGEIYLISVYCPSEKDIESCLTKLYHFIGEKQVIICIDASVKSVWWSNFCSSDYRGKILEEFILANRLCVMNRKDPRGKINESSADVTLASEKISKCITWELYRDWNSGGKRNVLMEITLKYDETNKSSEHPVETDSGTCEDKGKSYKKSNDDTDFEANHNDHKNKKYQKNDVEDNTKFFIPVAKNFQTELSSDRPKPTKKNNKSLLKVHIETLKEHLRQTKKRLREEKTNKKVQELLNGYYKDTLKNYARAVKEFNKSKISKYSKSPDDNEAWKYNEESKSIKDETINLETVSTSTFQVTEENTSRGCLDFEDDAELSFYGSTSYWEEDNLWIV